MKRITGALICSIVLMMGAVQTAEAQLTIALPDTSFELSETAFQLPIIIEGLSPDSILGFSFTVEYDSTVVNMVRTESGNLNGYTKTGTLSSGFSIVQNALSSNTYRVSGATTSPIMSNGVILYLNMEVMGEGISEVRFTDIEINEGDPPFTFSDGLVTVGSPVLLVLEQPLGAVELEEDFGNAIIADLDTVFTSYAGDSLNFDVTFDTTEVFEAGLVEDTHLLSLSSFSNAYGEGNVFIRAYTETAELFDTLKVTVNPVNDLPYFVDLPDTIQVRSDTVYRFPYLQFVEDVEDVLDSLVFEFEMEAAVDSLQFPFAIQGDTLVIQVPEYIGFVSLWMRVSDSAGDTVEVSVVLDIQLTTSAEEVLIPSGIRLEQNYPNPFNPSTLISYQLPGHAEVTLEVYDMLGRRVEVLVNQRQSAGQHVVRWDASGNASGMYIYRLKANNFMETRRMMLIK